MASINTMIKNVITKSTDIVKSVANETQNTIKTTLKDIFIDNENEKQQPYVIDSSNKIQSDNLEAKLKKIVDDYKNNN